MLSETLGFADLIYSHTYSSYTYIDQETRSRARGGRVEDVKIFFGVTRMDKIKNEFIRGTAKVRQLGDKFREARLRWYGQVQRRNAEYIVKRMFCLKLPGKRRRGRPKTRFMDVVREDMRVVGVSDRDMSSRRNCRLWIRCGDP